MHGEVLMEARVGVLRKELSNTRRFPDVPDIFVGLAIISLLNAVEATANHSDCAGKEE